MNQLPSSNISQRYDEWRRAGVKHSGMPWTGSWRRRARDRNDEYDERKLAEENDEVYIERRTVMYTAVERERVGVEVDGV